MREKEGWRKKIERWQQPAERYVLPVLLLLWPLTGIFQGADLRDTMYALGNYRFLQEGSTWYFATYLANLTGGILMKLPLGSTMAGMRLMTSLLISAAALAVYFVLKRIMPGWMIFLGEWIACSLCWCPSVILYNYLTYFLLTAACLLLFLAVWRESQEKDGRYYYLSAGFLLGMNVFVRFSNLTQAALILAVWFHELIRRRRFTEAAARTGWCLAGYGAGALSCFGLVSMTHGAAAYLEMIPRLFSMTSQASDYTFGGMILAILEAYLHSLRWTAYMLPCMAAAALLFRTFVFKNREVLRRVLYAAGILILIRFFYGRGMFTLRYADYWSMFGWGMQFLLTAFCLSLAGMAGWRGIGPEERFLSAMNIILLLILPLGSNNYTFPILNCLFLIAPVSLWLLRRFWQADRKRRNAFVWYGMAAVVTAVLLIQGSLFHLFFAFGDGTDGTPRSIRLEEGTPAAGIRTTPENAALIRGLQEVSLEKGWKGKKGIFYGNIPGAHYLLDIPPALSNLWPDLNSYPAEEMEEELERIRKAAAGNNTGEGLPVVVFGKIKETAGDDLKRKLLEQLIEEMNYHPAIQNEMFTVYETEE